MVNVAKRQSETDGKAFLRSAFDAEQNVLAVQLKLSSQSITHDGTMGQVNEQHFINVLRKYLPNRYAVSQGIVIDSNGKTSDQIDIVLFDQQYTPTLLDQQDHRFIPAEAVYGIFEVKPTINKTYLEYAADKAKSVRELERTSIAIPFAAGTYPPKPLHPIFAGIVAPDIEWIDGFKSSSFNANLTALTNERSIDCGLALTDTSFDRFDGKVTLSDKDCGLAFFLFRLLQKLQSLGTVPAIDWNKYASSLGKN